FRELDRMIDTQGRFIFLKGTIADKLYTLVSIYVPNTNQARFLRGTLNKLRGFSEGALIIGGDFNTPLDPQKDTSTGSSCLPHSSIRSIRKSMSEMGLVDSWRALNPDSKNYTHYSALHQRYSRIDYILLPQEGLTRLRAATIGPATWSDHGPMMVELESPLFKPARWTWRLNESLLQDPEVLGEVTQALELYFRENDVEGISPISIWEAHKSVIRGNLIRIASRKRKAAMREMAEVYETIAKLELQHKRTQHVDTQTELLNARRRLRDLITRKYYRSLQYSKNFFYIHANKGGKFLARLLK
ncbi:Hypothetical predicted protein, partial [Pelobates cultripes]